MPRVYTPKSRKPKRRESIRRVGGSDKVASQTAVSMIPFRWASRAYPNVRTGGSEAFTPEEQMKHDLKQAVNFNQVLDVYLTFLHGKGVVPTYGGALNEDTVKQLGDVIAVNELGLLTLDSQDGLIKDASNGITKQRAYVIGLMPKVFAAQVIERFQNSSEYLVFSGSFDPTFKGTPALYHLPVTVAQNDKSDHGMVDTATPLSTDWHDTVLLFETFSESLKQSALHTWSQVLFIDVQYGRAGALVKEIRRVLQEMYDENHNMLKLERTAVPILSQSDWDMALSRMDPKFSAQLRDQKEHSLPWYDRVAAAASAYTARNNWLHKAHEIYQSARRSSPQVNLRLNLWMRQDRFGHVGIQRLINQLSQCYMTAPSEFMELDRQDMGMLLFPFTIVEPWILPNGQARSRTRLVIPASSGIETKTMMFGPDTPPPHTPTPVTDTPPTMTSDGPIASRTRSRSPPITAGGLSRHSFQFRFRPTSSKSRSKRHSR